MIGPDYFRAMNIPIHSGRDFTNRDTLHSQPVAIINDIFARRHWPNQSPVGAHIKIDDNNQGPREVEIIGVVGGVRHTALNEEPALETYVTISQIPEENVPLLINNMSWVIRTSAEPLTLAGAVQREIQSVNGSIATSNTKSMEQFLSLSLAPRRFNLFLLGIASIAALILASMGIYAADLLFGSTAYAGTGNSDGIGRSTARCVESRNRKWVEDCFAGHRPWIDWRIHFDAGAFQSTLRY